MTSGPEPRTTSRLSRACERGLAYSPGRDESTNSHEGNDGHKPEQQDLWIEVDAGVHFGLSRWPNGHKGRSERRREDGNHSTSDSDQDDPRQDGCHQLCP